MEAGLRECFFMHTAYTHATALPFPTLPVGIDPHYETEHWLVWNDRRRTNGEHTFVYEVSWIPELGVWRWFLRAHGVIPAGGEVYTAKNCV
jgi:hypothetical protein